MATTDTTAESLTDFRVAMVEELGFSTDEATKLTDSFRHKTLKDAAGFTRTYEIRVDHHYIRKMMNGGATKEQILAILT